VLAANWVIREKAMPRVSAIGIEVDPYSPTGYSLCWEGEREGCVAKMLVNVISSASIRARKRSFFHEPAVSVQMASF